jgi:hypothetical protein
MTDPIEEVRKILEQIKKEKMLYGELEMLEWLVEEAKRYESILKGFSEKQPEIVEEARKLLSRISFGESPDKVLERVSGIVAMIQSGYLWDLAKKYGYSEKDAKFTKWFDDFSLIATLAHHLAMLESIKHTLEKPETKRILEMR